MNTCEGIRELIPWYVEGRLNAEEDAAVALHLVECAECLHGVATTLSLRSSIREALDSELGMSEVVWERVSRRAMGRRVAQLDLGSFMVGLRLGAWLTRRGMPVRADLRVLGREVGLVNRGKRGGST